jgi:propionyl-CoA carboxylase beta chain
MDAAVRLGSPIVGLNDSGAARIQEGVVSLGGYADIFLRNTLASGGNPRSGGHGPWRAAPCARLAITDFTIMWSSTRAMFVTLVPTC